LTLRIIEHDRELYEGYTRLLRERARLPITIRREETDFSEDERQQIESALQDLLAAELIRYAHDRLRASGVSEDLLPRSDLRTSLKGVPLPETDQRVMEAKVRQLAFRMELRDGGGGRVDGGGGGNGEPEPERVGRPLPAGYGSILQTSHAFSPVCICMATGIPGTTQSLSAVNPLPAPPPGRSFITIGVSLFVSNIWGSTFSGDTLLLRVDPGAAFGIGPGQMQVGLASSVSWAKEIYAWNLCRGRLASVHQSGPNSTPSFMMLTRGCNGADTIIFTKPQFGGIWADVANFDFTLFWTVFGGRRLTFTWLTE
jgi:hypothetical protein